MGKILHVTYGWGGDPGMSATPKGMAKIIKGMMNYENKMRKVFRMKPNTDYSKHIKRLR